MMEDIIVEETPIIEVSNEKKIYPLVEEMTFRASIKSEEQGYALLKTVQIMVNELGADQILSIADYIYHNPSIIQRAKKYLPYLKLLG